MFSSLNFLFRRSVKHYDKIIFLDFDGVLAINNPRLCDVPKRDRHGIVVGTSPLTGLSESDIVRVCMTLKK